MNKEIKQRLTSNWFKLLQNIICKDIEKIEKNKIRFKSTAWKRNKTKDEGGGEFRILKNGKVFEKVGVNFSEVHGRFSNEMKKKNGLKMIKNCNTSKEVDMLNLIYYMIEVQNLDYKLVEMLKEY